MRNGHRRLGAVTPRCPEQVQRTHGVDLEVEERNRRGAVVRRLRRGVNDGGWADLFDEPQDAVAIADIARLVAVSGDGGAQAGERSAGVALGAEEDGAMVIVEAGHGVSGVMQGHSDLGSDQATRSGH